MPAKIIEFPGFTKNDMPVEKILHDPVVQNELEGAVICGFKKNGEFFAASSYNDAGTVLWILERAKLPVVEFWRPQAAPEQPDTECYEDDGF